MNRLFVLSILCLGLNGVAHGEEAKGLDIHLERFSEGGAEEYIAETEVLAEKKNDMPLSSDGKRYEVGKLDFAYTSRAKGQPDLGPLQDLEVPLLKLKEGYVSPRRGEETTMVKLGHIPLERGSTYFFASALTSIAQSIVSYYNELGIIGVYASVDTKQITREGVDIRGKSTALTFNIKTLKVGRLRARASGDEEIEEGEYDHITENAPVKSADTDSLPSILDKKAIDEHVYAYNRYPQRRIDVRLVPIPESDDVAVDYLVTENKPWRAYVSTSNIGTDSTREWYERAGFVHYQLTGRDDSLSIDYTTAAFEEVNSVVGSYEAPFVKGEPLRWRVHGMWSEYNASQFAVDTVNFSGDQWSIGARLIGSAYQHYDLFLDWFLGARWQRINVNNSMSGDAESNFLIPVVGLSLQRFRSTSTLSGFIDLDGNLASFADTEKGSAYSALGRTNAARDWYVTHFNFQGSWYLEPLLNREAWEDTSTPESSTLAHEVAIDIAGQYAWGNKRLISQMTGVLGGFYTVRGYEQYLVSGDHTIFGRAEYRLHIPRLFPIQPDPSKTPLFGKPFRFAPQQVYGFADWDLIFRAFCDAGRAIKNSKEAFEYDATLIGAGLGLEFRYKNNLSLRADWGIAGKGLSQEDVDSGSQHFHMSFNFSF